MILTPRNATTWSRLGSRATFGLELADQAPKLPDLMVLTADTSTSAGLDRFRKGFPEQFLDVGIAEQNLIGIAAGLASEGFNVVTATFAPFQTLRCCEQIRVNLGYMKHKVTLAGLASGVVLGPLGYTHCCIEDLAVMRAIPGLTVLSPADCGATVKAVQAALAHPGPVYLRLTGGAGNPVVYTDDVDFTIGRGVVLREGGEVALLATGTMVRRSLDAAALMAQQGLAATVVDLHTIKPIDQELIERLSRTARLLVTVEEHSITGGLGAAVAEQVARLSQRPPQLFLGLPDAYGMTGDYADILDHYGLTAEAIAATVSARLQAL